MKKCDLLLNKLRNMAFSELQKNYENSEKLIKIIRAYLYIKDLDESSNFYNLFNTLYLDKQPLSYDKVSEKYFLDVKTLYRFRKWFAHLADIIAEIISSDKLFL